MAPVRLADIGQQQLSAQRPAPDCIHIRSRDAHSIIPLSNILAARPYINKRIYFYVYIYRHEEDGGRRGALLFLLAHAVLIIADLIYLRSLNKELYALSRRDLRGGPLIPETRAPRPA